VARKYATIKKSALIVTAHPDDEVMFFAPLILSLLRVPSKDIAVYVLCLSEGLEGKVRRAELEESLKVLNVKDFVISDRQDGPKVLCGLTFCKKTWWSSPVLLRLLDGILT